MDGRWTRQKAKHWLQMAQLAFEVVYDFAPDANDPDPQTDTEI